jgi:hypothetical protein
MNRDKIRPEWVPSGYKEMVEAEKAGIIKTEGAKYPLYNRTGAGNQHAFKRKKVN